MEALKTIEEVFAYRLRKARGDLTQAQFAEFLGTSPQNYQRWESGAIIPQAETRVELAKKLRINETALFLDPDLGPDLASLRRIRLYGLLSSLDDDQVSHFLGMIEDELNIAPSEDVPTLPKKSKRAR